MQLNTQNTTDSLAQVLRQTLADRASQDCKRILTGKIDDAEYRFLAGRHAGYQNALADLSKILADRFEEAA